MGKIWFAGALAAVACGGSTWGHQEPAGAAGSGAAGKAGGTSEPAGAGGRGGAHAGTGGEAVASSGAPSSAGDPGESGAVGDAGAAGGGGEAGGLCLPTPRGLLCEGRECGTVADECGGEANCGSCSRLGHEFECVDGACQISAACTCHELDECGRLDCPIAITCGDLGGGCSDPSDVCTEQVRQVNETESVLLKICDLHIDAPTDCESVPDEDSCCLDKPSGCRQAFASCPWLYAVDLQTGEACGSCFSAARQATLNCGPGW